MNDELSAGHGGLVPQVQFRATWHFGLLVSYMEVRKAILHPAAVDHFSAQLGPVSLTHQMSTSSPTPDPMFAIHALSP
jgi:hypothetical protein